MTPSSQFSTKLDWVYQAESEAVEIYLINQKPIALLGPAFAIQDLAMKDIVNIIILSWFVFCDLSIIVY